MSMNLQDYLENKPLYYDIIDYTRMPRVYARLKASLKIPKIIHLIGTNGKGTTGRFLASALYHHGLQVGHYTSPHIVEFNERIWMNGENVSNVLLDTAHQALQALLTQEESNGLSYFEYTTLLAVLVFQDCDYIVMEAGLGGEHDATAVFDKELTLITPIDFDHESFLGSSIEAIATTKINAIQKHAILGVQRFSEVYDVGHKIANQKGASIFKTEELLTPNELERIEMVAQKLSLAKYLQENLKLSVCALKALGISWHVDDFDNARLFGRMSRLAENIYLDVGHNPLAAASLADAFKGEKVILVYNTYKDKDYSKILSLLQPILLRVEIIEVHEERIVARHLLESTLQEKKIPFKDFKGIDDKEHKYLVFGSFSVAETFLKNGYNIE